MGTTFRNAEVRIIFNMVLLCTEVWKFHNT